MGIKKLLFCIVCFTTLAMILFSRQSNLNYKTLFASNKDQIYIFEIQNGKKTKRILTFENNPKSFSVQGAIYTKMPDKLPLKYYKMMLCSLAFKDNPYKVLVLGMGIGTIPREISRYYPDTKIDIVEINPAIPQIAMEYFDFKQSQNINIFMQDAYDFVMNTKNSSYDLIFIDVFDDKYIPAQFLQDDFTKQLKSILTQNGIAVFNTVVSSKTYKEEEGLIVNNFPFVLELKENNRILFASNKEFEKQALSKELSKKIDFHKYSAQLIKK